MGNYQFQIFHKNQMKNQMKNQIIKGITEHQHHQN